MTQRKKTKEEKANEEVNYFNKVKEYVLLEYSEELAKKMSLPKYLNITFPYCKNCLSLKKPVPYAANEIVRFITKTY
jgi:hypothetical protein